MADNRISITIDAKDDFSSVMAKAAKEAKKLGFAADKAGNSFGRMGASIIVANQALELLRKFVVPIINMGNAVLKTTDKFRRLEIALTSLTGDVRIARAAFVRLRQIAKESPQSLDAITDSFVRLKSTGVKDTERVLKGIINAVSAFGGTEQDIKLVALAFQQMAGKGVVSMEELRRQLGERVPTAMRILAREMGLTLSELFAKVEKGQLDSFIAIEALTRGFEKDFSGAADRMLNTWESSTIKMKEGWEQFLRAIGETGLLDAAIAALQTLTGNLGEFVDKLNDINKASSEIPKSTELLVSWAAVMSILSGNTKGVSDAFNIFAKNQKK